MAQKPRSRSVAQPSRWKRSSRTPQAQPKPRSGARNPPGGSPRDGTACPSHRSLTGIHVLSLKKA
ncbi:MAG: hypothetical protein R3E79_60150 [Caldilineaceae bacterium]